MKLCITNSSMAMQFTQYEDVGKECFSPSLLVVLYDTNHSTQLYTCACLSSFDLCSFLSVKSFILKRITREHSNTGFSAILLNGRLDAQDMTLDLI